MPQELLHLGEKNREEHREEDNPRAQQYEIQDNDGCRTGYPPMLQLGDSRDECRRSEHGEKCYDSDITDEIQEIRPRNQYRCPNEEFRSRLDMFVENHIFLQNTVIKSQSPNKTQFSNSLKRKLACF
jgi:hypothetical protein